MATPGPDEIDQRLHRLGDAIVKYAAGSLDVRMEPSPAGDRVDGVIVAFNMMAEELQWLTDDMERRVAERTFELASAQQELERLALYDALTGLANRTLLSDRITRAVAATARGGGPPAVLVLDLDGFKSVNDTLGHAVGDLLLVEVARRLEASVRDIDTVARLGGDEFAVVLLEAGVEEALDVAERISAALRLGVPVGKHTCWVDASIGIRVGARGEDATTLLPEADTAMYAAKSSGRGGVQVFDPGMHAAALARVQVGDELQAALAKDQLVVHYQPIVELATGRPVGVEALVRWQHPVRGLLGPEHFVPLAEDTGRVVALDRWVRNAALAQFAAWRAAGAVEPDFGLHVNVSALEIRSQGFVGNVLGAVARHGVEPSNLILEVTETRPLGDDAQTLRATEDLLAAGVGLAVDDFGVGYSSLGYLQRLDVATVKIDRSLITGLDRDLRRSRIAAGILGVIDAYGSAAVAEGVETITEAKQLLDLGCRYGQGFYWSPGVPGSEIPAVVRRFSTSPPPWADTHGGRSSGGPSS